MSEHGDPKRWQDLPFANDGFTDVSPDGHPASAPDPGRDRHSAFDLYRVPETRAPREPQPDQPPEGHRAAPPKPAKRHTRAWIWGLSSAVLAASVGTSVLVNREPSSNLSRAYGGVTSLTLSDLNGDLELARSPDQMVRITLVSKGSEESDIRASAHLDRIRVADGRLAVGETCGDQSGCRFSYRVEVPSGTAVSTTQQSGQLTVLGTEGSLRSRGATHVSVLLFTGDLDVESTGAIDVTGLAVTGLSVKGGNRPISIGLTQPPARMSVTAERARVQLAVPAGGYVVNPDEAETVPVRACSGIEVLPDGAPSAKVIDVETTGEVDLCTR